VTYMTGNFLQTHKLVNTASKIAISLHSYQNMNDGNSLDHFEYILEGKNKFFPLCDYCTYLMGDRYNENPEEALRIFWQKTLRLVIRKKMALEPKLVD
jgi:hypothetical protein